MIGSVSLLDIILPLLIFAGIYWCSKRAFVRTLVSVFTVFLSFTVAALLYNPLLNWFAKNVGPGSQNAGSVVFGGLTLALFFASEWMINRNYPDMRIYSLGNADHILGAIVGVIWTALVISLVLLVIQYASLTIGVSQFAGVFNMIEHSGIANLLRSFFGLVLKIEVLLFPGGLPDILRHFAI